MAGKTTQKHDERGGRYLDSYKRYDVAEAGEPDNITPIIDVAIKRLIIPGLRPTLVAVQPSQIALQLI